MSSAPPSKLSAIVFGTALERDRACGGAPPVRARRKLRRHRRHRLAIDREGERHAADHVVGIAVHVQRADVAAVADRGALAGRGQHRMVLVLDLAEHDLAGAGAERERAQIVAVEAAHARAERLVAERHAGLLDRGREDDVEADHLGAAVDDRGQHLADLARPGDARRALERRRAEGFLVERDHDGGRSGGLVRVAERAPAQRGQDVDRKAAHRIERRGDGDQGGDESRSDERRNAARSRTVSMIAR